jgi:hypothetical protein
LRGPLQHERHVVVPVATQHPEQVSVCAYGPISRGRDDKVAIGRRTREASENAACSVPFGRCSMTSSSVTTSKVAEGKGSWHAYARTPIRPPSRSTPSLNGAWECSRSHRPCIPHLTTVSAQADQREARRRSGDQTIFVRSRTRGSHRGREISKSSQRGAAYVTTLNPLNTCTILGYEPTRRESRPGSAPGTTNGPLG